MTYGVYLIHSIIIFLYYTLVETVINMSVFQLVSFSFFCQHCCFGNSFERMKSRSRKREAEKVVVKSVIFWVHLEILTKNFRGICTRCSKPHWVKCRNFTEIPGVEISWKGTVSAYFWANGLKICRNSAFPQDFSTKKLAEIKVFYAVPVVHTYQTCRTYHITIMTYFFKNGFWSIL